MKALNQKILDERQAWPLDRKVYESKKRIKEWYQSFDGKVMNYANNVGKRIFHDVGMYEMWICPS